MFFSKKKKAKEESDEATDSNAEAEAAVSPKAEAMEAGDPSLGKLTADVEKLKAQFSTFYELQKASNERFGNITEQLGGIRSMMIERDKDSQRMEAKATQAIDLVKSVQPDKFMVDLRKMDSKIEALKANLEGNENVMKSMMNEMKEMRNKMSIYKGMEQVLQLNDDVKKELMDIKRIEATVGRHADKVETMFSEIQKRLADFVKFNDLIKDLDKGFKQISSDFDSIKIKVSTLGTKKEVEDLTVKMDNFEKYVSNIVLLINKNFESLEKDYSGKFSKKFEETDKLLTGFRSLAERTPDLDRYFNLLSEEAKKKALENSQKSAAAPVEAIKELGAEESVKIPERENVLTKVGGAFTSAAGSVAERFKKK